MSETEVAKTDTGETVESLSGHPEGTVLENGETITGSYDKDGKLTGWHKLPAEDKE